MPLVEETDLHSGTKRNKYINFSNGVSCFRGLILHMYMSKRTVMKFNFRNGMGTILFGLVSCHLYFSLPT